MSIDQILGGFGAILTPEHLLYAFLGCFVGTLFGVLPGLGPVTALAVLFPITTYLDPTSGIIMMAAIYYGGMYGGSTTAILLNIPGEVSSLPSAMEGYPLTKRGRAGVALGVAAVSSFIAGIVGTVGVMFIGPLLARLAVNFGSPENFSLILFSLTAIAGLASGAISRGLLMGFFGILLSTVGLDANSGIGILTFGSWSLAQGLGVVPIMMGLFGIGEVLRIVSERSHKPTVAKVGSFLPTPDERRRSAGAAARGTVQGFFFGLIPGMLPSITSFLSYSWERRRSIRRGERRFGNGALEGIAGPEAANNSTAMSGFVPLFSLGIPTGPSMSLILASLLVYGLVPGPTMFAQHGDFVAGILVSFLIANIILLALNLPLVGLWAQIAKVPFWIIGPIIIVACLAGAYLDRNSIFDAWVCMIFGFLGWFFLKADLPLAPLVMGLILGPDLQQSLRQTVAISPSVLVTHPISLVFLVAAAAVIALTIIRETKTRTTRTNR